MPLPVVDETKTLKSCITNGPFGRATRRSETSADSRCSARVSRPRRNRGPQVSSVGYRRPSVSRGGGVGDPRPTGGRVLEALERKTLTLASPKGRGMSEVNLKWSRETDLRRLESMKQMYTQRLAAR